MSIGLEGASNIGSNSSTAFELQSHLWFLANARAIAAGYTRFGEGAQHQTLINVKFLIWECGMIVEFNSGRHQKAIVIHKIMKGETPPGYDAYRMKIPTRRLT